MRLLDQGCWYRFTYWMANSTDPDQLASSETKWSGAHNCLQRQCMSGFSRTRVNRLGLVGWCTFMLKLSEGHNGTAAISFRQSTSWSKIRVCGLFTSILFGGSVGCAIWLETRRSWVQPQPRLTTFFRGDWSWNIFFGHSLPSADSRRVVVSFWRKNVHNTG